MQRKFEGKLKQDSVNESNDNRKKYTCDSCDLTVFSRSGIRRHFRNKHLGLKTPSGTQDKTEVCTVCAAYVTKRNFKDHVNSHSSARDYKCDLCGSAVKSIFTLRKHIKKVHMKVKSSILPLNMKTNCDICDKQFSSPATFQRHELRYHSDSGNITCEVCDKKSLTIDEHSRHMKIHTDSKFQCGFCDARFVSNESLKVHLIRHKSEWSYECGLCSKVFKHSSSVSSHRKSHKLNGYYHCGGCDDRFKDYGQLKLHFTHSGHSFYSE
ncbi:hypothetical protein HA402_001300 [Bradysia odoriphaga]|nr:hypothetical protein HA402_001300 [Bradysia odoriphaga]